jgi:flagellar capping protein FliD
MSDLQQEGEINSTDNIISDPANSNVQTTSDNSNNAGDVSILRNEINVQFDNINSRLSNQDILFDNQFSELRNMFQAFISREQQITNQIESVVSNQIQSVKEELVSMI